MLSSGNPWAPPIVGRPTKGMPTLQVWASPLVDRRTKRMPILQVWTSPFVGRPSNRMRILQMVMERDSGSAATDTQTVRVDRELTIFPAHPSHGRRINLAAADLNLLMLQYAQKGLVYELPSHSFPSAINRLEKSLSQVLVPFYPLAGRLNTSPSTGETFIHCNDAGASFTEASAEHLTVKDVMAVDVPDVVFELFPLNGAFNIEGHRLPLLAVRVTKLRDGIFLGCSLSHGVVDGASLWHFLNFWADICSGAETTPALPSHARSSPSGRLHIDPNATVARYIPPPLRLKFFHFSNETLKGLKERANRASLRTPVSTLQALSVHLWQAVTRARGLGPEERTSFIVAVDYRARVTPPLPVSYCGNAILNVVASLTAGELASSDVSSTAQLLHEVIRDVGDQAVREWMDAWDKSPQMLSLGGEHKNLVLLGGSPRFRMYETDFGWGPPVAARSGCATKLDGRISSYPGRARDGSVDLELFLSPKVMEVLENDQHFLNPLE